MAKALVLAGGGVAGIAWETGVLRGIEEVAPDLAAALRRADVVLGTSAGSTVAAQLASGTALSGLYQAQLAATSSELAVEVDLEELFGRFAQAVEGAGSPLELRRRIGALALATPTVEEGTRRAVIQARLPAPSWGPGDLRIVAVDAATGEEVVFDRQSGVDLVDAVAASCAVPGVWPPVTIGARRYVDGGVRSSANVDLAAGCDPVVVLSPAGPEDRSIGTSTLQEGLAALGAATVAVVHADDVATAAFGSNPLSPETRRPAAEAGLRQGRAEAERLAAVWS